MDLIHLKDGLVKKKECWYDTNPSIPNEYPLKDLLKGSLLSNWP